MEFHELQQIVESNSRSIQALGDRTAEILLAQEEAREERQELRQATLRLTELVEGLANLTASLDDDRPTILGRLNRIENKIDRLLQSSQEQQS